MDEYIRIGRTKKPHGINGELKVAIDDVYLEDFLQARLLFVKTGSNMLPHFLQQVRGGAVLIAHFEDCQSREAAEKLAGKEIYVRQSDLLPDEERVAEEDSMYYRHCIGFMLRDNTLGQIGIIEHIEEYPQQEMAVVSYLGKKRLVPLHEKLIVEIDKSNKVVVVSLPEGLLDL